MSLNATPAQTQNLNTSEAAQNAIELSVSVVLFLGMALWLNAMYLPSQDLLWPIRWTVVAFLAWLASRSNILILFSLLLAQTLIRPKHVMYGDFANLAVFVVGTMLLMAWILRYNAVRRWFVQYVINRFNSREAWRDQFPSKMTGWVFGLTQVVVLLFQVFFVFVIAWTLFQYQPWINDSPWFRWALSTKQALWPGATFIVVLLFLLFIVNEWCWRLMTVDQKQLYLRVVNMKAIYSDLRRIVRLRMRKK